MVPSRLLGLSRFMPHHHANKETESSFITNIVLLHSVARACGIDGVEESVYTYVIHALLAVYRIMYLLE